MENLQKGLLEFTDIKYVKIDKETFRQFKLNKGDILFNRTNSFELVGKTSIFEAESEYCFASYLIKIVVNQEKILSNFLNLYMNTDLFQKNLKNYAKQSNNQANINAQILLAQKIPLPSLLIQEEIIAELEHERNIIEANKETIKLFENKLKTKLNFLWQ
ncbi:MULTISPECIES: restriction endonuclease subunit S [spotted fever group]|uniref:EcoKI restriction-modification system protein HsdS n=1 Tax=Rickettsia tamurae subsp. buchneri TaxID=1462938 RepID=A0A8E0WLV7_9RICK|nr:MULTISPECIES: restriction endonuclease subunit S [spotted fever group]EER22441.1 type I restriction-modification enzyme, S subunit [Rickettsia endosymbiont of Ixodes scapularis]KDO03032.1 EcoKI restriction-modification system protein HsdS [Rickettsia tamurae subsp. buchneri]